MKNEKKQGMTAELAEGKILPLVFKLTIPAVIAQLITFLYNIVDRMYVARIEGSGMDALAALGIVLPITLIMQAFANLVGLGGAPRAGIKLGEGNPDEANRIFHTAFCLLVLLCTADRATVRLPGKRGGVCRFLPKDLRLRHDFCHAGAGTQPVYSDARLFPARNVFCASGRNHQHRARPAFYFHIRDGRTGIESCNSSLTAMLVHMVHLLFLLPKKSVPLSV